MIMKTVIEALNRRYATKKFDTTKKLSQADMDVLLESLRLSPSSFGLQPWKFIHVKNTEMRKELQDASRGQPQITEASDLIVIAVRTNLDESDVDAYVQDMKEIRGNNLEELPEDFKNIEKLMEFKNMMLNTITARTQEQLKGWNQKQAYIAMGTILTTAALLWIDACPMEWFDPEKYNEILGLSELWLTATVVIPVGYRSEDDKYAYLAKVRFPKEKVIIQK